MAAGQGRMSVCHQTEGSKLDNVRLSQARANLLLLSPRLRTGTLASNMVIVQLLQEVTCAWHAHLPLPDSGCF